MRSSTRSAAALGALAALAAAAPGCGPAPGGGTVFADATEACGLDFVHYNGATGELYLPEIMGSGCAFLDHDQDGDLDIYAVQGALLGEGKTYEQSLFPPRERPPRSRLFRNELATRGGTAGAGKLRFTDVTDASGAGGTGFGMGCAVGDYDNDGDPDLYVTRFGPNVLYENAGGTFRDVTDAAGVGDPRFSASAAFLDYDRDGLLDLFVASYVDFTTATHRRCTRLGGLPDYCGPGSYSPVPDRLYRNAGGGAFRDVTAAVGIDRRYFNGLGVACADFDGDGWIDIFVANDATPNQLWLNRRGERFEDTAVAAGVAVNADGRAEAGMGVAAGDYDRDGDLDLFITHEVQETNTLYRCLGPEAFEDATAAAGLGVPSLPYSGFGTRWFDYDNDGWLDLFAANGAVRRLPGPASDPHPFRQPDQLFHSEGGRFVETTASSGLDGSRPLAGRGTAFGDVDNDGDVDLLVSNNTGPLKLYLNNVGSRRGWLRVELRGTRSNRDGYGARVAVHLEDGVVLWQSAGTDGSYASASDPRLHFGLGDALRAERVVVRWPAGGAEAWEDVPANAQVLLVEGQGKPVE
ncbi:MAG: CRTAC1 family protein [Planctomycetes bacterium]|nr:CRTAC1 family protein [Planctomycetota bacterium]